LKISETTANYLIDECQLFTLGDIITMDVQKLSKIPTLNEQQKEELKSDYNLLRKFIYKQKNVKPKEPIVEEDEEIKIEKKDPK
jgi:hypothetical protein